MSKTVLILNNPSNNVHVTLRKPASTGPLQFTALTDGAVTLTEQGSPDWTGYFSTDGTNWTAETYAEHSLTKGSTIYFEGEYAAANSSSNFLRFECSGHLEVSGNIMSLCSGDNYASVTTIPYDYMFYKLFEDCSTIEGTLWMPAITLTQYCYAYMFKGCTSMVTSPKLPATALAASCYTYMFQNCTSLVMPPRLMASSIPSGAYVGMFYGCASLQVYDSAEGKHAYIWKIPQGGSASGTTTQRYMFRGTEGSYSSTTNIVLPKTVYTQTAPYGVVLRTWLETTIFDHYTTLRSLIYKEN